MSYKAIVVIVKCDECGQENAELIPLQISEKDWRKTQKKHGLMIVEDFK